MIDWQAEIIPGTSAAGFVIGMCYEPSEFSGYVQWDESKALQTVSDSTEGWLRVDSAQVAPYHPVKGGHSMSYARGAIDLRFNASNRLYQITVSSGYLGKFAGKIGIGDRLDSVLSITDLELDSGDEMHYPTETSPISGIGFIAEDYSLDESPDQLICGISVQNWDLQHEQ